MTDDSLKSRLERATAFDERAFYELCQAYRHTPLPEQPAVADRYRNLIAYANRTALIDQRLIEVAVAADVFIHGGLDDELGVKLEDALDALREALKGET